MVSLGQSEAPHQLSPDKSRQIFLFGLLSGELVDGVNDQRALHTEGRPVGAVHPFNLLIYQPIGSLRKPRPAELRQGAPQKPIFSHQFNDTPVEGLRPVVLEHPRQKVRLRELPSGIDDLHRDEEKR